MVPNWSDHDQGSPLFAKWRLFFFLLLIRIPNSIEILKLKRSNRFLKLSLNDFIQVP